MSFKCTLWPSGEVIELKGEKSLLLELKEAGKKIKSSCGGCATCSDCSIIVKSGESNLTPQTFEELRLLGNVFHITKERLSCQAKVLGEVTLDISAHEKATKTESSTSASGPKSTTTKLKKRDDLVKAARENEEKGEPKSSDSWYKHWEKGEQPENQPKKLGGNRRPRSFTYSDDKEDEEK